MEGGICDNIFALAPNVNVVVYKPFTVRGIAASPILRLKRLKVPFTAGTDWLTDQYPVESVYTIVPPTGWAGASKGYVDIV